MQHLQLDINEAADALITAKIKKYHFANRSRAPETMYNIGDRVMVSNVNRHQEYAH